MGRPSPVAPILLGLAACAPGDREPATTATRDSAGIVIVENRDPVWPAGLAWRINDTPLVEIGVASGDPNHELFRVQGAVRLADGGIVIANAGTFELRYYDRDGRHVVSAGGRGGGPGEFNDLRWLARVAGDTVVAHDARNRRVSVFDGNGTFVRSVRIAESFPTFRGVLDDAGYVTTVARARNRGDPPVPLGLGRDSLWVVRYDADGVMRDTLGGFLRRVRYGHMLDFQGRTIRPAIAVMFTPTTHVATGDRGVYVGTSEGFEYREYDPDFQLTRVVRLTRAVAPVHDADVAYVIDSVETLYGDGNPEGLAHLAMLRETPPPDSMPAYSDITIDDAGNVWVLESRKPGDARPVWQVFDAGGRWLGRVEGPDGLRVTQIGTDYVLGVLGNRNDVERVRAYRILKPESS